MFFLWSLLIDFLNAEIDLKVKYSNFEKFKFDMNSVK